MENDNQKSAKHRQLSLISLVNYRNNYFLNNLCITPSQAQAQIQAQNQITGLFCFTLESDCSATTFLN